MTRYEIGGCPACGSTSAALVADGDQIRAEIERLWSFHTRRIRGDTPPDRLLDRVSFSQDPPLQVVRCTDCTLLYRNPRERADELVEIYSREQPHPHALAALFENQKRSYRAQARRLTKVNGGTGAGLEIGTYVGAFLAASGDEGWQFQGVDVNENVNRFARDVGGIVHTGTIDDLPDAAKFDAVVFWNCFDQLADPRAAARAARLRLRPGGVLAVRVPNGDFYRRWRARLESRLAPIATALLAHNNLLGFPYRHGFSPSSLSRLLEHAGFTISHVVGDSLVTVADGSTRAWAAAEERFIKSVLRTVSPRLSPWIELYATSTDG